MAVIAPEGASGVTSQNRCPVGVVAQVRNGVEYLHSPGDEAWQMFITSPLLNLADFYRNGQLPEVPSAPRVPYEIVPDVVFVIRDVLEKVNFLSRGAQFIDRL